MELIYSYLDTRLQHHHRDHSNIHFHCESSSANWLHSQCSEGSQAIWVHFLYHGRHSQLQLNLHIMLYNECYTLMQKFRL